MMTPVLRRMFIAVGVGAIGVLGAVAPASAQVVYAQPDPFFSAPDETAGTSPSFEISPAPYDGAPAVRVVERCQYPNGWNATDFSRDVNGTPAGIDHTCPAARLGGRLRTRY